MGSKLVDSKLCNICLSVTVYVCLVDTVLAEGSESLLEAYERRQALYQSSSCCDYSLRVVVTSWSQQIKQDMQLLVTDKGTCVYCMCTLYSIITQTCLSDSTHCISNLVIS